MRWSYKQKPVTVPMRLRPNFPLGRVDIELCGVVDSVKRGAWSRWFAADFAMADGVPTYALARFRVLECRRDADGTEKLSLYLPAMSVDPARPHPLVPLCWPRDYAASLAAAIGPFATLGWASPTNARKDEQIDDAAFLEGLNLAIDDDLRLLDHELEASDWHCLFAVCHGADHAGHMCWPDDVEALQPNHPVLAIYRRFDAAIGTVLDRIDAGALGRDVALVVLSDHGMSRFARSVELNRWLCDHGYLTLFPPKDVVEPGVGGFFHDVDWTRTRAYAMGLGKIYLNVEGREPNGIVKAADAESLAREIARELETLRDPARDGARVVRRAYLASEVWSGPFASTDADIVLGFEAPYRVDWYTTGGGFAPASVKDGLRDNTEPWSGDHCSVDASLVPGVLFSNRPIDVTQPPRLLDIAPSILALLGVEIPSRYEGRPLLGH